MADLNIHSASPLSSKSSQQSLSQEANVMEEATKPARAQALVIDSDIVEDVPLVLELASKPVEKPSYTHGSPFSERRPSRTVPRLNTKAGSIAATAPLPWKVDETSSPYTPTAHTRKPSFAPPPRSGYHASIDMSNSPGTKLPPLSTGFSPPSIYTTHHLSSPYSSSPMSNVSTNSQNIDLSHPPGYSQTRDSFTDRSSPSLLTAPEYTNSTPFYQNNCFASVASPMTPTRRGRGILDNDPNIYLRGEGDGEDETVWDTAAKWAKAAGKRLSIGEEMMWKMMNVIGNGDER